MMPEIFPAAAAAAAALAVMVAIFCVTCNILSLKHNLGCCPH
jgi:hypothetical protein